MTRIIKKVSDIKGLKFGDDYIIDVYPVDPLEAIEEKYKEKCDRLQGKVDEYLEKEVQIEQYTEEKIKSNN